MIAKLFPVLLLALPVAAYAAEEPRSGTPVEAASEPLDAGSEDPRVPEKATQKAKEEAKETAKGSGKRSGDIFLPSEEISEDFAVSFPVDI